jgi:TPP-dependent trihydroxycyclohexane-1,2-dione (THcHDO) dehydratase
LFVRRPANAQHRKHWLAAYDYQLYGGTVMASLGPSELLIILAIVVAIFGVGKLAGIGGALGSNIRACISGCCP